MTDDAPQKPVQPTASAPVRWHQSLYFRVILLCGVLLLCLLGSVFAITRFFFNEAAQEMQAEAHRIAEKIQVRFDENPDQDLASVTDDVANLFAGENIEIRPFEPGAGQGVPPGPSGRLDTSENAAPDSGSVYLERDKQGRLSRVAHVLIPLQDETMLMTLRVPIRPQVEILRAFTNRYMLSVTGVFVLALGLMIYFIAKSLRPLTRLSDTCAAISQGNLQTLNTRGASGEIQRLEETFNQMVGSLREKEMVEAKLRQAQRLSALGNLAAGVAHDVRNPLNAIKLLSSHALDNVDAKSNGRVARPLESIRREVDHLEEIVSSFLSLAKETELDPQPHKVDDLLHECIRLFKKDAEQREVRLISELRAGETPLMLDQKQWTRAILNVLLNALEACPPGGRVRLFSRLTDSHCEIEIRDDGPGLDKDHLERVFDPYYTTKPGGTGLGLSITRGIIEEHGGAIELTSVEGKGCQVLIVLPLETAKAV